MDSVARIGNWPLLNTHNSGKIMFFENVHVRDCYGFSPLITFAGNVVHDSILQHPSAVHMLDYMRMARTRTHCKNGCNFKPIFGAS